MGRALRALVVRDPIAAERGRRAGNRSPFAAVLFAACPLALAACGSGGASGVPRAGGTSAPAKDPIQHVVIIVQENRSFDNIFSGFPGADAPTYGYAGTTKVQLHSTPLEDGYLNNNYSDAIDSWDNGKMDDFDEAQPKGSGRADFLIPTCPERRAHRIGRWPNNTCWPTTCSRPSSVRVLRRIST
jgi:hypothetical protein